MEPMTDTGAEEGPPVKAFISYAWTDDDHVERVRRLADYLITNGVEAILDRYRLRPGMDADRFMEQVAHEHVQKVIAICDANYVQKANNRTGGVGKEGTIMSQQLYEQLMSQGSSEEQSRRFVAVIFGLTDGKPAMPAMFGSSMYIDMSTDEKYDANLDQLLRFILDQPELVAPPIGKIPAHLRGTPAAAPPTFASAQAFRRALEDGKRIQQTFRAYLEALLEAVRAIPLAATGSAFDYPKALAGADAFLPVRNEFVELMRLAAQGQALDADLLGDFFEASVNDTTDPVGLVRDTATVTELVRTELMLYLTAICIRERQAAVVTALTDRTYFIRRNGDTRPDLFGAIYYVSDEFRRHYKRIKDHGYTSPEAEWLRERATLATVTFSQLQEADLLLSIKSRHQRMQAVQAAQRLYVSMWYGPTSVYWGQRGPFELFARFTSRRELNPWLPYFGVKDANELRAMIQKTLGDDYFRLTGGFGVLEDSLKLSALGTMN